MPLKTWKKTPSKVTHDWPPILFFSIANWPKTSPNLIFYSMKMCLCAMAMRVVEFSNEVCRIKKDFCIRINISKEIFWTLWMGSLSSLQKSEFFSWLFHSSIIFGAKIEISRTKWVEKTPIYIFSTFGSKINEFERKKLEKNEKIPKT